MLPAACHPAAACCCCSPRFDAPSLSSHVLVQSCCSSRRRAEGISRSGPQLMIPMHSFPVHQVGSMFDVHPLGSPSKSSSIFPHTIPIQEWLDFLLLHEVRTREASLVPTCRPSATHQSTETNISTNDHEEGRNINQGIARRAHRGGRSSKKKRRRRVRAILHGPPGSEFIYIQKCTNGIQVDSVVCYAWRLRQTSASP